MDLKRIFETLGIEITKSELTIKKAYQEKVKEIHPEERPVEWQELYQAYKNALSYAKGHFWFLEEFYDEVEAEVIDETCSEEDTEDVEERSEEPKEDKGFYNRSCEGPDEEVEAEVIDETCSEEDIGSVGEQSGELKENKGFNNRFYEDFDDETDYELGLEDVYHSFFTDLHTSGEKTKQENMTQVMKHFDSLANAHSRTYDWQLIELLKSPLFRSCWEEELVLFYLKRALEQVKDPDVASQISEVLEEMIEHLAGTMEVSKVNQVKKMLFANRKKEHPKEKKRLLRWVTGPRVIPGAAVIIGFMILILVSMGNNPNRLVLSESEAKELIIVHLEDKYGLTGLSPENITLTRHSLYWMQPTMQVGFRGEIGGGHIGNVMIIGWREEGNIITYVFDDFQVSQISRDLGALLLEELNLSEGELFLSSSQNMRRRSFLDARWAGFNTYYTGDLQLFFEQEAETRSRIVHGLFTDQVAQRDGTQLHSLRQFGNIDTSIAASRLEVAMNLNGRATLYIRDPEIETLSDRLINSDRSHLGALEEVLAAKAQIYQIQIHALVLPQSYYDEVFLTATVDEELRTNTLVSPSSSIVRGGMAPISPSVLTAWYHSEDERVSSQLFSRQATEVKEGVFVINDTRQARPELPIIEWSECLEEVWEYLQDSSVLFNHSVSFNVSGHFGESILLILDVEKLDILAANYTIADVHIGGERVIRSIELLNFSTTIRESIEQPMNVTVVEGYLIIPFRIRFGQDRMVTIVFW